MSQVFVSLASYTRRGGLSRVKNQAFKSEFLCISFPGMSVDDEQI